MYICVYMSVYTDGKGYRNRFNMYFNLLQIRFKYNTAMFQELNAYIDQYVTRFKIRGLKQIVRVYVCVCVKEEIYANIYTERHIYRRVQYSNGYKNLSEENDEKYV